MQEVKQWGTVKTGLLDVEVCSIEYAPFGEGKKYRYLVSREKNNTGQTNVFSNDDFTYRAILTTDNDSSTQEVIQYYNEKQLARWFSKSVQRAERVSF